MDLAKHMRTRLDTLDQALAVGGGREEDGSEEEDEAVAAAWEELQEHVENLDYALVFCQIGGLPTLFRYLQSPGDNGGGGPASASATVEPESDTEEARVLPALSVLAALTQNNPRVQAEVLGYCAQQQLDLLALLCGLAGTAQQQQQEEEQEQKQQRRRQSVRLRAKALHALSCTVRTPAPTPLEERFVSEWAGPLFRAALAPLPADADEEEEDADGRMVGKALFFLQALLGADHADRARGEALGLPLLPCVVPFLRHRGAGVRHAAAAVVAELANRLGGPEALLASPAGPALRGMMAERRAVIAALPAGSLEREEAADEARFWEVVEGGGRFLRDGEMEGGVEAMAAAVMAGGQGGGGGGEPGQQEQEGAEGEAAAPVLLLEPPKLTGASQAP